VISIATAVLPHAKVVNWMITFGASFSSEIDRLVSGRSSDAGSLDASHTFSEVLRVEILGRKSDSFWGDVAVTKGIPISVEVLYVTQIR
jgi:hypothetical protein